MKRVSRAMKIQQLSADDAIASLNSGPQGLTANEALRRLQEYGPNHVEQIARESLVWAFLKDSSIFSP
jgi:sodium/potassium-transporting ATPase subunit alpha